MGVGEASTGGDSLPLEELKRFSAIREVKKTLAWAGMHLASNGVAGNSPAIVKLREAYAAVLALETKPVVR